MNLKAAGAMFAILMGIILTMMPSTDSDTRSGILSPEQEKQLAARSVHIDPAELLNLIHDSSVGLRILDVRDEADYNLFHIIDADYVSSEELSDPAWIRSLPGETAFVLVSNDEERAVAAWKTLVINNIQNLYILDGGVNFWLDIYGREYGLEDDIQSVSPRPGDDTFRYTFKAALGDRHPGGDPDPHHFPERTFTKKVEQIGKVRKKAGGCG